MTILWNILSELESDVSWHILTIWLVLNDVVRLDSSLVKSNLRCKLHEILRSTGAHMFSCPRFNEAALKWFFHCQLGINNFGFETENITVLSALVSNMHLIGSGLHVTACKGKGPHANDMFSHLEKLSAKIESLELDEQCSVDLLTHLLWNVHNNIKGLRVQCNPRSNHQERATVYSESFLLCLSIVAANQASLMQLELSFCLALDHPILATVSFPVLRELNITVVQLTSAELLVLANACRRLQTLRLKLALAPGGLHEGLCALARSNPGLTSLSLPIRREFYSEDTLLVILDQCRGLHTLIAPTQTMSSAVFRALLQSRISLRELHIDWGEDLQQDSGLKTEDMRAVFGQVEAIVALKSGVGLATAVRHMPRLQRIEASESVDAALLVALADSCTALVSVTLSIDDQAAYETLCLVACRNPYLSSLSLHSKPRREEVPVTDELLHCLGQHCAQLRLLSVSACFITDAGMMTLATGCPQLRELSIPMGSQVTEAGVLCLLQQCNWLRSLSISNRHVSQEFFQRALLESGSRATGHLYGRPGEFDAVVFAQETD